VNWLVGKLIRDVLCVGVRINFWLPRRWNLSFKCSMIYDQVFVQNSSPGGISVGWTAVFSGNFDCIFQPLNLPFWQRTALYNTMVLKGQINATAKRHPILSNSFSRMHKSERQTNRWTMLWKHVSE